MKILFFIDGFRKGGKERRLIELLKSLENEKIDYKVVIIHPEIEYEISTEIKNKIIQINKDTKKDISIFLKFYRICKTYDPDIIHTWSSMVTFYAIPAKILQKKKLVNSQIVDAPPKFSKWTIFGIICKINFFFSDFILSNSKAGIIAYKVSQSKSKIIYNGIDLKRFDISSTKEELKKELGLNAKFLVVMVASFSEYKDYKTYIEIANRLSKTNNQICFISVGNGINIEICKKKIKDFNLINFLFLGKRGDVEKILKACDIGVLISTYGEGCSNAIIEYMASNLAVIVNNMGGNKELIKNNINGFLVNDDYINCFSEIIMKLVHDESLRVNIGNKARKTIVDNFLVERMSKQFIEVYCSLKK